MARAHIAFLLMTTSVLIVPYATSEDELSIPGPMVGSEATYLRTIPVYPNGTQTKEFTLRWEGQAEEIADGFDAVHHAYALRKSPSCFDSWYCETITWLDVSTRAIVRVDEETLFEDEESSTVLGPVVVRDRQHASTERTTYETGMDLFHVLQGRTLADGDVFTLTGPPSLDSAMGRSATFTAAGWETVEGQALFRVEVDQLFHTTLWFDGVASVPARVAAGGTLHRLADWGPGDGPLLIDPSYSPPAVLERAGVQRTVVGFDGPDEPMSVRVPLQSATAALRAHPQGTLFFAEQTDAYLAFAHFQEAPEFGVVFWSLSYEGATGWLGASLVAPLVPEDVSAPVVVQEVYGGSEAPLRAPPSDIVGHSFACYEEALAVIDREDPPEPDGGWSHSGLYRVESMWPAAGWDVTCVADLWPPERRTLLLGEYAVPAFDLWGREAVVHGTTGAISIYNEIQHAYGTTAELA